MKRIVIMNQIRIMKKIKTCCWNPLLMMLLFIMAAGLTSRITLEVSAEPEPSPQRSKPSFDKQNQRVITIGAVFEESDQELEYAFREAVDRVSLLSKTSRLEAYVVNIKPHDSFRAAKIVCRMIEKGVWAIFGPTSPSVTWLVRSIANNLHIPHIQINWDYRHSSYASNMTINLYPEATSLSRAYMDLIRARGWKSFTLVYEENEGIIKMKDILRLPALRGIDEVTKMSIRQFSPGQSYKKLLKDMSKKFERNVILNVPLNRIKDILRSANEVGMMTEYHNYLITDLDMHTLDFSDMVINTNITGMSLLDPKSRESTGFFASREWVYGRSSPTSSSSMNPGLASFGPNPNANQQRQFMKKLTTEPALLYDAVFLFSRALDDLERTQTVYPPTSTCDRPSSNANPWIFGSILINFMKMINLKGLTGPIKFDPDYNYRSDFILDILEQKKADTGISGWKKLGTWDPRNKINITRNFTTEEMDVKEALRNKTLRVTVPTNAEPYVMLQENNQNLTGNDRFEGYCIDLIQDISKILGFKFEIYPAPNNAYGSFKNGEWNGMIRELLDHRADMAIADFTMTSARQGAVDFTLPFMNLGISILFKKPEDAPPDLFSFLKPFSLEVWVYMATAFLGVSLLLYVISRLSPYEWVSGHPCEDDPDELENQFSLGNCLWFTVGSLMQQGSDLAPRALSTRTLASIWWFFTLIMISSYTANLAAFLTVSRMASPIENAEDLAKQTTIQYGCKSDGSTFNFFKTSNHSTYERMWSAMESIRPTVFVNSNTQGIERVKKGNYAYLAESTSIEYEIQRNCDLMQIGGLLDQKGYGIATPPDSPYRGLLSEAILHLQESGRLAELKNKWWVERIIAQGITCPPDKKESSMELDIGNVGGVFVVLLAGTGVGCLIVIIEFVWKTKKVARHERVSPESLLSHPELQLQNFRAILSLCLAS